MITKTTIYWRSKCTGRSDILAYSHSRILGFSSFLRCGILSSSSSSLPSSPRLPTLTLTLPRLRILRTKVVVQPCQPPADIFSSDSCALSFVSRCAPLNQFQLALVSRLVSFCLIFLSGLFRSNACTKQAYAGVVNAPASWRQSSRVHTAGGVSSGLVLRRKRPS